MIEIAGNMPYLKPLLNAFFRGFAKIYRPFASDNGGFSALLWRGAIFYTIKQVYEDE